MIIKIFEFSRQKSLFWEENLASYANVVKWDIFALCASCSALFTNSIFASWKLIEPIKNATVSVWEKTSLLPTSFTIFYDLGSKLQVKEPQSLEIIQTLICLVVSNLKQCSQFCKPENPRW